MGNEQHIKSTNPYIKTYNVISNIQYLKPNKVSKFTYHIAEVVPVLVNCFLPTKYSNINFHSTKGIFFFFFILTLLFINNTISITVKII